MSDEMVSALDGLVAKGLVEKELVPGIIQAILQLENALKGADANKELEPFRKLIPEELMSNLSNLPPEQSLMLCVAIGVATSVKHLSFGD
jgi:hypothetical protein